MKVYKAENPGEFLFSLSFQSEVKKNPSSLLAREWKPRFMIMGVYGIHTDHPPPHTHTHTQVVAAVHTHINTYTTKIFLIVAYPA